MLKRKFVLSAIALSVGIAAGGGAIASAHGNHPDPAAGPVDNSGAPVFLAAELNGKAEVPTPGGPKVGDPDGEAVQVIRIQGNQVSFGTKWKKVAAPTAAHIHEGKAGVNGAIKVPFFGAALPDSVSGVVGRVTVDDAALLKALVERPGDFYSNLHTAEFPGGAVRGQFRKLNNAVDLNRVLHGGELGSLADGFQEVPVPNGPAAGDPDAASTSFVEAKNGKIDYSFSYSGVASPTIGHIHRGNAGTNGPVVAELFKGSVPATITGIAGTAVKIPNDVIRDLNRKPGEFYTNLHTTDFPGGAARGQLFRAGEDSRLF